MDLDNKVSELANLIKNSNEFKTMKKTKSELDKNRNIKKQFDNYINKKNKLYSNYQLEDASAKVSKLNQEYNDFFNIPIVSNYMNATKNFNNLMEKIYKSLERDLLN